MKRLRVLVVAFLAVACARQETTPTANPSKPLEVFMNVCLAPGLTPQRVIRYAQSESSWREEERRGDFENREGDVAEIAWTTSAGGRTRLTMGGYFLNKWFAWPLDNNVPSYECKVEFSGGDPLEVARAVRAAGFGDLNSSRPTPLQGWEGLTRRSPDGTEHWGRWFQLVGHGCVVDFRYDLEPEGPANWHSRELNIHCPQ